MADQTRQLTEGRGCVPLAERTREIEDPTLAPIGKHQVHVSGVNRCPVGYEQQQFLQLLLQTAQVITGSGENHLPRLGI